MKLGKNLSFQQISSGLVVPVLVLITIIAGYFMVWPKYQEVSANKDLLEEKQLQVAADREALSQVSQLIDSVQQQQDDLDLIDSAIPEAPGIPELLANFDYLAGQSGIIITSVNLTPVRTAAEAQLGQASTEQRRVLDIKRESDDLGIIEADVNLIGDYLTLKNFLLNLEQNLRLMDVQELNFSERDEDSGLQEYNLKIHTYYQMVK